MNERKSFDHWESFLGIPDWYSILLIARDTNLFNVLYPNSFGFSPLYFNSKFHKKIQNIIEYFDYHNTFHEKWTRLNVWNVYKDLLYFVKIDDNFSNKHKFYYIDMFDLEKRYYL